MTIIEVGSIIGSTSVVVGLIAWVVTRLTSRPQCGDHARVVQDIADLRKTDELIFSKIDAMQVKTFEKFDEIKNLLIDRLPRS